MKLGIMTLPMALTFSRIAVVPVFIAIGMQAYPVGSWTLAALFALSSLTDGLDGYLARRWNQVTSLGKALDPIADKLMVVSALLCVIRIDEAPRLFLPVGLLLLRECCVSSLRSLASPVCPAGGLPVSGIAKCKTALQMIAITLLLLPERATTVDVLGWVCLYGALGLSVLSGLGYLRQSVLQRQNPEAAEGSHKETQ